MDVNSNRIPENKLIEPHESARVFLYAVIANLAVQIFYGLLISYAFGTLSAELKTTLNLIGSVLIQLAYLFVYFRFVRHKNLRTRYHMRSKLSPACAILSGFASLCLLAALFLPMIWLDNLLALTGFVSQPLVLNGANLALCVVAVVIGAPLIEELMFRGVLLGGFAAGGAVKGVMLAALAFMLSHFNPAQTVFQFFVGAVCGFAVVFTGSLWAGIIAHAVNNLAVLLIDVTPLGGILTSWIAYLIANPVIAVFVTLGAAAVSGALLALILVSLKRTGARQTPGETNVSGEPGESESGAQSALAAEKGRFAKIYFLTGCGIAVMIWVLNYITAVV